MQLSDIDVLSPELVEDPYAQYDFLREHAPVHWDPKIQGFLVSRHADVYRVLCDAETFSSQIGTFTRPPSAEAMAILASGMGPANTLITADPPQHTMYRAVVKKAFTPRRVAKIHDHVKALAHDLIDSFIEDGEVEFVSRFAAPLPLIVIAEQLGVPRDRVSDFKRWSDAFLEFIGGLASDERSTECAREILECQNYFLGRIADYRENPQDDMLGTLLHAQLSGANRPLNDPEMTSILQQFMLAGNETSTAAIGATQRFLLEQPDALAAVRADRSLVPAVMEEVFRLESPVQNIFRVTTRDTEIAGVEIPAFSRIGVMFGSANRDPRVFPDPARLDPHRSNIREHLAFGQGNHYCIGAGLARLEGAVALDAMLDRFDSLRFAPGMNDFAHNPMFIARGLKALHLEFG